MTITTFMRAALVALGLVFSAYASEVFLGAFRGIGRGQYEAAHALGLRPFATMRLVILPQALRIIIPPLTSDFLTIFKNSSLALTIGRTISPRGSQALATSSPTSRCSG